MVLCNASGAVSCPCPLATKYDARYIAVIISFGPILDEPEGSGSEKLTGSELRVFEV